MRFPIYFSNSSSRPVYNSALIARLDACGSCITAGWPGFAERDAETKQEISLWGRPRKAATDPAAVGVWYDRQTTTLFNKSLWLYLHQL